MSANLVLRTVRADMTSHGGFVWPESGRVEAPDWDPTAECGNGLHGLLDGQGVAALLDWSSDARWLVVRPEGETVDLSGKVKFAAGTVEYCGDRAGALAFMRSAGVTAALPGDVVTAGDYGTATAGDYGTAAAGNYGTATAGNSGTATAGDHGTATAGYSGTVTAGDHGVITIRYWDGTRRRLVVGYVGEDNIKANTPYRLDDAGKFVKVTP